ncbi:MAG TPA: DUF5131 family protein [Clostridiales bacterium]|nr:DUF5131 family protein [Clostridiales bacterium]
MDISWNPWHGCHKLSAGCQNCYVYRTDAKYGKNSNEVKQTGDYNLPIKKARNGDYKIKAGAIVYTCFTSDFFVEDADLWRGDVWRMIRTRSDLTFFIITKRIDRFYVSLPPDWGTGYDNVVICCTAENQSMADFRLPIYKKLPIAHKMIICSPLLESINLMPYLDHTIEKVTVGGESGSNARICDYEWVLDIHDQCVKKRVTFWFQQTGARFRKANKIYSIERKLQHSQAKKANINFDGTK